MDTLKCEPRHRLRLKVFILKHYVELSYIAMVLAVHITGWFGVDISLGPMTTPRRIQTHPVLTAVPVFIFIAGMVILNKSSVHRVRIAQVIALTYWVSGLAWLFVFDPGGGLLMTLAGGQVWRSYAAACS